MAFHFITTMEKPAMHIAMADWRAKVDRLRNISNARCADTFAINNSARTLRSEARIEGNWANFETNEALTDRVSELNLWRSLIVKVFNQIELEIQTLQDEVKKAEEELVSQARPIAIISQTMSSRDGRLHAELTHDEPDKEIKNELYILENNQRMLANCLQIVWEKMKRIEEVRFKISKEIRDKGDTVELDNKLLELNYTSANISYKLDPLRNPRSCCSYENWLLHTKNVLLLAENELADLVAIRESLFLCREKSRTMMLAQQDHTEYVLRRRIFQTEQLVNELEWQDLRLKEELKNATCEISSLEDDYRENCTKLKLAETRLEARAMRCVTELCLDRPHDMLILEAEKLREVRRCLLNKTDEAKANLNLISDQAGKVYEDLESKKHSLMTDTRTLTLLQGVKIDELDVLKPQNPCVQTDRNILLTGVENAIPKY